MYAAKILSFYAVSIKIMCIVYCVGLENGNPEILNEKSSKCQFKYSNVLSTSPVEKKQKRYETMRRYKKKQNY